jgi:hypothetical protein
MKLVVFFTVMILCYSCELYRTNKFYKETFNELYSYSHDRFSEYNSTYLYRYFQKRGFYFSEEPKLLSSKSNFEDFVKRFIDSAVTRSIYLKYTKFIKTTEFNLNPKKLKTYMGGNINYDSIDDTNKENYYKLYPQDLSILNFNVKKIGNIFNENEQFVSNLSDFSPKYVFYEVSIRDEVLTKLEGQSLKKNEQLFKLRKAYTLFLKDISERSKFLVAINIDGVLKMSAHYNYDILFFDDFFFEAPLSKNPMYEYLMRYEWDHRCEAKVSIYESVGPKFLKLYYYYDAEEISYFQTNPNSIRLRFYSKSSEQDLIAYISKYNGHKIIIKKPKQKEILTNG